jgi:hypothetical protein
MKKHTSAARILGRLFITAGVTLLCCAAIQLGSQHFAPKIAPEAVLKTLSKVATSTQSLNHSSNRFWNQQPAQNIASSSKADESSSLLELKNLGEKVRDSFPKNSDFSKLSDEQVHTMPKKLFAASLQLKLFADELQTKMKQTSSNPPEHQKITEAGAHFYESCASEPQAPSSLRAVCFIHFIDYSVKSGHPQDIPKLHMPLDVIEIAKAITPSHT